MFMAAALPGAATAQTITADQALESYRDQFRPVADAGCPTATGEGEIVVCGRRDGEAGRRLPLPIERDPGEVGPRIGEAPTGSDALSAERCIRLCQSQVGVNLDMVIKVAEGIGRLLEGDD